VLTSAPVNICIVLLTSDIVQGSGIGPTQSDLHTLSEINDIFKYADDTNLLVPQHTDIELDVEFNHVKSWTAINQLILNLSTT